MPPLIPKTGQTVSTFSYSVLFDGKEVGNLQTFTPSQDRTLVRVRSLAQYQGNVGETIEIVNGVTDTLTVEVTALELYSRKVMEFMGYSNFASIEQLLSGIDIMEILLKPNGSEDRTLYSQCWVKSFGKSNIQANGNVVTDRVTFWVTKVLPA